MQDSIQQIVLQYSFPDIGEVSASLHKEAAQLYIGLESIKEIERLEHLDHLGELRAIHKTAHYSRWEYVMLQLFMIDALKKAKDVMGLSQSINIDGAKISSGFELLKCWALLLNFSHLKGVFDAERVWLELLSDNQPLRDIFYCSLRSDIGKKGAEDILKTGNVYGLHKYLGLALLYYLRHDDKKGRQTWRLGITLLESYLRNYETGSVLNVCKNIFARVRQVAFTSLDLNYCPLGIRLNLSLLLNRIIQNPKDFFYDEGSPFVSQMNSLDRMLFQNIYANPQIVQYRIDYILSQKQRYKSSIERGRQEPWWTSIKRFCRKIREAHKGDFGKIKRDKNLMHYLRLDMLPDEIMPREPISYYYEQKWLDAKASLEQCRFIVTPVAFANRSGCFLDVFNSARLQPKDEIRILWTLIKYIPRYYAEYKFDRFFMEFEMADYVQTIFNHILRRIFKKNYNIRFQTESSPLELPISYIASGSGLNTWRKRLHAAIKKSSLQDDRKLELNKLHSFLKREKRGTLLISCCRARIFNPEHQTVAEFDGMYANVSKGKIEVVFIETKRGITLRSEKARTALNEALKASLKISNLPIIRKRKEMAYSVIRFKEACIDTQEYEAL